MRGALTALSTVALLAACSGAVQEGTSPTPPVASDGSLSPDRPQEALVRFQVRRGRWVDECRGINTASGIATVWHCSAYLRSLLQAGKDVRAIDTRGRTVDLAEADFPQLAGPDFGRTDAGSEGLDFTLIRPRFAGSQATLRRKPVPNGLFSEGATLWIAHSPGAAEQCHVEAVCGSRVRYSCDHPTQDGWSGSPTFIRVNGESVLIGLHAKGPTLSTGQAIAWNTVLGRIRALRSPELDGSFAQRSTFRHRWNANLCPILEPQSGPLQVSLLRRLYAQGVAEHDAKHFWAYDNDHICLVDVTRPAMNRCVDFPDRTRLGAGINGVKTLSQGRLLVLGSGDTANILRVSTGAGALSLEVERVIQTDLQGTFAAYADKDRILLGGEYGFCLVEGQTCQRTHSIPFHVNDITYLPDGRVLAVGRYRRDAAGTDGYCMFADVEDGKLANYRPCSTLPSVGALRSPVVLGNEVLLASSIGAIYRLQPGGQFQQVPIIGLPGNGIEDAIRQMMPTPNGQVAIVGSDGSLRLFQELNAPQAGFRADPKRAVFDRAIWLTSMAVGDGWIAVRGQDNQVHLITGL